MIRLIVTANKLNKRKFIPAKLPEPNGIAGVVFKDAVIDAEEVTDSALPNPALGKWYKGKDDFFYWAGGVDVTVDAATPAPQLKLKPPVVLPHDMPISRNQCIQCTKWLKANFENKITAAVAGTPFDNELLYAIACQETAYRWYLWIDDPAISPQKIIERCVFDASGDFPDTTRGIFPKNAEEFLTKFDQPTLDMLIAEGNKMRAMPQADAKGGYKPAKYLYKGYGIFQYDLQFIIDGDKEFFVKKLWYSIDECITRVVKELKLKWINHTNDYLETVRAYNGSGTRAEEYAQKVSQFYTWIKNM